MTATAVVGYPANRVAIWQKPFIDRLDQTEFNKLVDWCGSHHLEWPSRITHLELVDEGRYAYWTNIHDGFRFLPIWPDGDTSWDIHGGRIHLLCDQGHHTQPLRYMQHRHIIEGQLPRPVLEHITGQMQAAHERRSTT